MQPTNLSDFVTAFYILFGLTFLGAVWSYNGKDKIGRK